MAKKRLTKEERRILKEDVEGLKWLSEHYRKEGKLGKAAACEKEMEEIKAKLKGVDPNEFSEKES